jgi:hypothetical protein
MLQEGVDGSAIACVWSRKRVRRVEIERAPPPLHVLPNVQIKSVPQDVHRVLRRRAADAGQTLEAYLRALLVKEARQPTLDEVLGRVGRRRSGRVPLAEAAKAVRDDRDPR